MCGPGVSVLKSTMRNVMNPWRNPILACDSCVCFANSQLRDSRFEIFPRLRFVRGDFCRVLACTRSLLRAQSFPDYTTRRLCSCPRLVFCRLFVFESPNQLFFRRLPSENTGRRMIQQAPTAGKVGEGPGKSGFEAFPVQDMGFILGDTSGRDLQDHLKGIPRLLPCNIANRTW